MAPKAYDAEDFINELRSMNVTPHVAQNTSGRRSAIDRRATRHCRLCRQSRIRKRIEEAFGWIKTVGGQGKTKFRGRDRVGWAFTFSSNKITTHLLPKHVVSSLLRAGYLTLAELRQIDERKLRAIPGIGAGGRKAIRAKCCGRSNARSCCDPRHPRLRRHRYCGHHRKSIMPA